MIVIVGGRISGLTLAGMLARQGERVIVLERGNVSLPTMSIALICPDTLAILDQIGFSSFIDELGYPQIRRLSFEVAPGVRVAGPIPYSFGRNWGYAIRRELFDRLLTDYLRQTFQNITIRDGFRVTQLESSNGRVVGVRGVTANGEDEALTGDLVIGADGRMSTVARLVDILNYDVRTVRTCFYYAYFRNVDVVSSVPSLVTYHGTDPFPIEAFSHDSEDGLTGIGFQCAGHRFAAFKKNPDSLFKRCVNGIEPMGRRMRNAVLATKIMGIWVPEMYKRKPYGHGWALVGDASLYINPITGQGISLATHGALWLSEAIKSWRGGVSFDQAMHRYHELRDKASHYNYERAASAADIETAIEPWRAQWYEWMSRQKEFTADWLAMLSNAIPPETFFSEERVRVAKEQFGEDSVD